MVEASIDGMARWLLPLIRARAWAGSTADSVTVFPEAAHGGKLRLLGHMELKLGRYVRRRQYTAEAMASSSVSQSDNQTGITHPFAADNAIGVTWATAAARAVTKTH